MGLDINLILEVRRDASESWTAFHPRSLGIQESPERDYPLLETLGLYPDKIESPSPVGQRGLPNDTADMTIQQCCQVVFRGGGVLVDAAAEDRVQIRSAQTLITRKGVVFSYSQSGFCRNYTWFTLEEIHTCLEDLGVQVNTLGGFYRKLLERGEAFKMKGFEVRIVGWVCN